MQAVQRTVGMNLVMLWDASDQLGLKVQLVLGGLLFTQLAEPHFSDCTGNATKARPLTCDIAFCICSAVWRPA